MKKKFTFITLTFMLGLFSWNASAQVTVAGSVSGNITYSTLAAAIAAIPTSGQSGNNITVAISAGTTETSTITINNGDWATLKIYPTANTLTCTGVNIALSGAKNVTIDGRVNQTGTPAVGATTSLTLSSTSTTNPVISFDNDAQSNTVQYCNIKIGALPNTTGGIYFGLTAATTNGNGNNVIDRNLITSAAGTNGSASPFYAIYATGNTNYPNKGNQITNNYFTNFMYATGGAIGILVLGNATGNINDNYTISGNSMYGGITTNSGGSRVFIQVGSAGNGGSHTIKDNYIGGTSAQCGGTKMIKAGSVVSNFGGIYLTTSGSGTSVIENNTIKNINWSKTGTTVAQNFIGISVSGTGNINILGNSIGDNTTSQSIYTQVSSTTGSNFQGIQILTTAGTVDCENNKIGSIKAYNDNASGSSFSFSAINKSASAGNVIISNNTIGSLTVPRSIIDTVASASAAPVFNGINCQGTALQTVNNNTIANISHKSATAQVYGISITGAGSTNSVNANFISALSLVVGSTGQVQGISNAAGTSTITNNVIKLGVDSAMTIYGINNPSGAGNSSIYHNTIYISGSPASGSNMSSAINSFNVANNIIYKNNIAVNARSNSGTASGSHYAINLAAPTTGSITADYNNYFVSGTNGVFGRYNNVDVLSLPIVTNNDAASIITNPSFANAGGNTAVSYVPASLSLTGVDLLATVAADYSGVNRTTTPTMGAHDYRVYNGSWNTAPTTDFNARIDGTFSGAGFAARNLVVNAGKRLNITSGTLAVANNFSILSNAADGTGTYINDGTLTLGGTSSVQQYLSSMRNWYMSSPVSGANALPTVSMGTRIFYSYPENHANQLISGTNPFVWSPGNYWITPVETSFIAAKGYIVRPSEASTLSFSGTSFNSGEKTIELSYSNDNPKKGFNLVGNPYPAYLNLLKPFDTDNDGDIDLNDVDNNIMPTYWVRTQEPDFDYTWDTYNLPSDIVVNGSTLPLTKFISPMQAFWVRAKSNSATTLTLNSSMCTHQDVPNNKFRARSSNNLNSHIVRLRVSNDVNFDEAVLYVNENASNVFDNYDSPKMLNGNASIPEIYTTIGSEKLVINGMKTMPLNQEIALGFIPGSASSFSIKANEISNLPSDVKVILKDNVTRTETDLTDGATAYTFSPATTIGDRFSIIFRAPGITTGMENTAKLNAQVFVNAANQITIIAPKKCNYAIYNALGQLIENGVLKSELQTTNCKLQTGIFVVKVGNQSNRVIVK